MLVGMPDQSRSEESRALLLLATGAVIISLSPIFVKTIPANDPGPTAIGFWRTAIGAAGFLLAALFTGRSLTLPQPALFWAIGAGLFFAADLFCWHRAILYVGAGMATILGNTQVFGSAILSYLLFRERLTIRFFVAASLGLVAVALLVGLLSREVVFGPAYLTGIIFGLVTGIAYAGFIVSLKMAGRLLDKPDTMVVMTYGSMATAACLGIVNLLEGETFLPGDPVSWLPLAGLGIVVHVVGWWLISDSLRLVQTNRASLLLLLQPTLATIMGALLFQEQLAGLQILGAALTLVAIYYGSVRQ